VATRESVGSAALVGFLFLAFAVYFVRSNRARDRSARAAAELEVARDSALEASRAKSTFLATMSHEVRTPLTTVVASAEMLEDTALDGVQLRLLDKMRRASDQLKGLVEEVLDFSRIEAGQVRLVSERFDLHGWVGDVADAYASRADQAGVRFSWHVEPDVPRTVIGDRVRLLQIVGNVLDNAFKFTDQGQVAFAVLRLAGAGDDVPANLNLDRRETVEFVVTDTGVGIPEQHLTSIFESFRQVDGSITRQFGGSGLGLAIVKELTELVGGSVTVTSDPGVGSTFRVRVPVRIPADAPRDERAPTPARR
jgi:signal transduction histidine kinase